MGHSVARVVTGLIVLAVLASIAAAGDQSVVVRDSPFVSGERDVMEDGRRIGTVRDNPFDSRQLDVDLDR